MNCALVLGDQTLKQLLKRYLSQLPGTTVVFESCSCERIFDDHVLGAADLLFLDDVCLQESGVGFLNEMEAAPLLVGVNISATRQEQLGNLPVFSYLQVPASLEKLIGLFDLAIRMGKKKVGLSNQSFFFVKSDYKIVKINFSDILFCEGMKDYTQIFLDHADNPVITLQNLKSVCEKLPASQFLRVHRSFVVAIDKIDVVTRRELMVKSRYIPIGNNYWEPLSSIIHQYS